MQDCLISNQVLMSYRLFPILVVYQTTLSQSITYQTLLRGSSADRFLVYDNSPASYEHCESLPDAAIYHRDTANGGLPAAYNYGAQLARQLGYTHVLLLDSDTTFPEDAWEVYLSHLSEKELMGPSLLLADGRPFSPCYVGGWKVKGVRLPEGQHPLQQYHLVNSGLCVPLSLFEAAGGYPPQVRLDFADFQFQQRVQRHVPTFRLLPIVGKQDFSNDERSTSKLLRRFRLYLESARHCQFDTNRQRLQHHVAVWRHLLALTLRQRSLAFLRAYFQK